MPCGNLRQRPIFKLQWRIYYLMKWPGAIHFFAIATSDNVACGAINRKYFISLFPLAYFQGYFYPCAARLLARSLTHTLSHAGAWRNKESGANTENNSLRSISFAYSSFYTTPLPPLLLAPLTTHADPLFFPQPASTKYILPLEPSAGSFL